MNSHIYIICSLIKIEQQKKFIGMIKKIRNLLQDFMNGMLMSINSPTMASLSFH